jgi:hypothetical protein
MIALIPFMLIFAMSDGYLELSYLSSFTTHATIIFSNWLGGTLSGPKRPIFRHTSQIFFTVALLRPTKIRFVWQKMATFLSQTRPR